MKRALLLFGIAFLNCTVSLAQGFVGINTATPTARLTIDNPNTSIAFQINHLNSGRVTRFDAAMQFYHEGDLWVHSEFGRIRYGYPDHGWYFATLNGGSDLELWSHSTTDLSASGRMRFFFDGTTGNLGIGTLFGVSPTARLSVTGSSTLPTDNALSIENSASVHLLTVTNDGKIGIGTDAPAAKLEVNNGFIRVSGTDKTAFKHTTTPTNISGNTSAITYTSPSPNDILILTHNYSPTSTYLVKSYGIYWDGSLNKWAVYIEDGTPMPTNIVFNVMVIKQ